MQNNSCNDSPQKCFTPKELAFPKWMINQANQRKLKNNKFMKETSRSLLGNEICGNKIEIEHATPGSDKIKDSRPPLDNFINTYECGIQCEKVLDLANLSDILIIGIELDWPSQYKAAISKISTIHLCYGENQCILFSVQSLQKLPIAFTHLLKHSRVKLVGHNLFDDLNKIARDFKLDTKLIVEKNTTTEPIQVNLHCEHGWTFSTYSVECISSSEVNDNLELQFKGKVYYSTNFQECAFYCEKLLEQANSSHEFILGFDLEWPLTRYGWGKVALMQICPNEKECYIFHIWHFNSLPKVLIHLLKNCKVKLTGLNIKNDIRKLGKDFKIDVNSIINNNLIELTSFANDVLRCYERWSLDRLVLNQLGVVLNKNPKVRISNWHKTDLSKEQLMYAATDAYASLLCYEHLEKKRLK